MLLRPGTDEAKKKARLEKLAAWKRQQEQQKQPVFDAPGTEDEEPTSKEEDVKVWWVSHLAHVPGPEFTSLLYHKFAQAQLLSLPIST